MRGHDRGPPQAGWMPVKGWGPGQRDLGQVSSFYIHCMTLGKSSSVILFAKKNETLGKSHRSILAV